MIINHNMAALNTYNRLSANNAASSKSLEKLSSGLRINRAGDDAAGLAISEKMRGQIRGLDQASSNAQNGISLIQTAEGALSETHSILQRMRELAVQSSNDTNTDADRSEIQKEINQLTDEVDRIASTTEFNTKTLMTGDLKGISGASAATMTGSASNTAVALSVAAIVATTTGTLSVADSIRIRVASKTVAAAGTVTYTFSSSSALGNLKATLDTTGKIILSTTNTVADAATIASLTLTNLNAGDTITLNINASEAAVTTDNALRMQIGANTAQEIAVGLKDMRAEAIGIKSGNTYLDVSTQFGAEATIARLDSAITKVSAERSKMGAVQNRLEHTISNLGTASENMTAAESRIRDVDMAKEMMAFQKNNILQQAATSMLAQANQQPQNVLQLLK